MSFAGIVETRDRHDTDALLEGLEVIARKPIDYKGLRLEEMDLDAILARRPQLVLVDDLAHTNPPGSRHPKRYMDVDELLHAGIDVHATLNIQHVESPARYRCAGHRSPCPGDGPRTRSSIGPKWK
ncbi:MAG: hypothetical protein WDN69_16700 [Aliidongia sp.]